MSFDQIRISRTIRIKKRKYVEFVNIDITELFLDKGLEATSNFLRPIVELIGHSIIATVDEADNAQSCYFIKYEDPKTGLSDTDLTYETYLDFRDNLHLFREFEITVNDTWSLLQKLIEEKKAHEATKRLHPEPS